ncbi:MAG TPA: diphthine synthase [Candidatus Methanoperedenaceae archaeon]|nr:diphthine synthase [Candidatus Methanoperedenaceae archaeon]
MLTFIGLGLYDELDVSLRGLEAIRSADKVYAEFYTSRLTGTKIEQLEELYAKKIHLLDREDVEGSPEWIKDAIDHEIVFLTGGDAMVSTTHIDLRLRAEKLGVRTEIIHGASIISAICGITGLQNYRFGRSTTIPHPYTTRSGKTSVSHTPYDTIKQNQESDLHTLIFLDIDREKGCMSIKQGIKLLMQVENERNEEVISDYTLGVGVARAGSAREMVRADYLRELERLDFGRPLHTLSIPASLHPIEAEALVAFTDAPKEILHNI